MKNLPVGIQTFRDFSEENYLYIDKTEQIHDLFARGGKYYFLSRPRRFGKSLLISILAELFSGRKKLFKGLWIYDKIQWVEHPVVHIDCSKLSFKTAEMLEKALSIRIEEIAANYGIELDRRLFLKEKFGKLLEMLAKTQKVVILIDEYDKPMVEYMEAGDIEKAKAIRRVLKDFYGIIKGSDAYLRFVFITGVSKFSKVSVFSDLNNLRDITLSREFSTLLGYTEDELERYFAAHIEQLALRLGMPREPLLQEIRKWYDGYSWDGENFVYNPFSILNLFTEYGFENYWFSTGTPTFLTRLIKDRHIKLMEFENLPVKSYTFDSYDIENTGVAALLFQTGYLTIKQITVNGSKKTKTYHLTYPNQEVRESFLTHLFGEYTQKDLSIGTQLLDRINHALENGDIPRFIEEMKSLFASIPHQIFVGEREGYYHSIIYLILRLAGAQVKCEESTNTGRIDAVLETRTKIVVMEFKVGSEQEALAQIKALKYYEKYLTHGKEIVLLGVGFDPDKRNIGNYLVESL